MSNATRDEELAAWAASDDARPRRGQTTLTGEAARAYSRDLLARAGQQPLEPMPKGQTSPRRQVRLPGEVSARLDAFARAHDRTPSAVMREAIERYLDQAAS